MSLPKNAISLEEAIRWISNWKSAVNIKTEDVIAHFIPHQDIKAIQARWDLADFRAYNAINEVGEFKLLIVGVDENGDDLVDYENGDYVYDFTKPCPSVCSLNEWWL